MDWHLKVHLSEAGVLVVVLSFIISASPWSGDIYPHPAFELQIKWRAAKKEKPHLEKRETKTLSYNG